MANAKTALSDYNNTTKQNKQLQQLYHKIKKHAKGCTSTIQLYKGISKSLKLCQGRIGKLQALET